MTDINILFAVATVAAVTAAAVFFALFLASGRSNKAKINVFREEMSGLQERIRALEEALASKQERI